MMGQQNITQSGFAAMGHMGQPNVVVPPMGGMPMPGAYVPAMGPYPAPPGPYPAPPLAEPAVVCSKCRAENPKTLRFCGNCGGQL